MALDLALDDELRREGLAREVVHAVQNARKDAGLEVEDRIELALAGGGDLLEAVRANEAYVTGETLATSLCFRRGGGTGASSFRGATRLTGRTWRVTIPSTGTGGGGSKLLEHFRAGAVEHEAAKELGDRVAVSGGGGDLFLYAGSEADAPPAWG